MRTFIKNARVALCELFIKWSLAVCPKDYSPSYVEAVMVAHQRGLSGQTIGGESFAAECAPSQAEIDGVARVFASVEGDAIAQASGYIMAKKLKRVFAKSSSPSPTQSTEDVG